MAYPTSCKCDLHFCTPTPSNAAETINNNISDLSRALTAWPNSNDAVAKEIALAPHWTGPFRLFSLPAELRHLIYQYAHPAFWQPSQRKSPPDWHTIISRFLVLPAELSLFTASPLARTCRAARAELRDIYFGLNDWQVWERPEQGPVDVVGKLISLSRGRVWRLELSLCDSAWQWRRLVRVVEALWKVKFSGNVVFFAPLKATIALVRRAVELLNQEAVKREKKPIERVLMSDNEFVEAKKQCKFGLGTRNCKEGEEEVTDGNKQARKTSLECSVKNYRSFTMNGWKATDSMRPLRSQSIFAVRGTCSVTKEFEVRSSHGGGN